MNAETFDFVVILSGLCLLLSIVAAIGAMVDYIRHRKYF